MLQPRRVEAEVGAKHEVDRIVSQHIALKAHDGPKALELMHKVKRWVQQGAGMDVSGRLHQADVNGHLAVHDEVI